MTDQSSNGVLRARTGHEARVSYAELFFDLVYVFAVTQLSHTLLHHLTVGGAVETLVLWFGVWLVWQYTCWFTNWFEPDALPVRIVLFVGMLLGLVMAAALPEAFGDRGLLFACCLAAVQVGRSIFSLYCFARAGSPLTANARRLLVWSMIAACFWIAGGMAEGETRIVLWVIGAACEYFAPMFGLWLPGLGRSRTSDWTVEGGHMVERCAQFVILALGESVLVTGATLSQANVWEIPELIAFLVAFVGSIAMWWLYFDTSSKAATEFIVKSADQGRFAAYFHYVHVVLVAGIIIAAVGNDLAIEHPAERNDWPSVAVLIGGPAIYIIGNAIYKRIIYGRFPLSHIAGLVGLVMIEGFAFYTDRLMIGAMTSALLIAVAVWEGYSRRQIAEPEQKALP